MSNARGRRENEIVPDDVPEEVAAARRTRSARTKRNCCNIGDNEDSIFWCAGLAEFIGTFIHVFLGIAIECLCRVVSTDSSLIEDYLPKIGWGLSWAVAFFVAGGISGKFHVGHIET